MQKAEVAEPKVEISNFDVVVPTEIENPKPLATTLSEEPKVSAFSISSIRAKKELLESTRGIIKEDILLPTEAFNETDLLLYWNKYAQRLGDKGHKIMEALLTMCTPILNGTTIKVELSNEGSKITFEAELYGILGYLKGHLHNHNITIELIVNESLEKKFAFTALDKYNRLNEINPNLELLKKTFDLDI